MTKLFIKEDIKKHLLATASLFDQMMSLKGEIYRQQPGRLTQRVKLGERDYFLKQHTGVGWKEILKNILQLRQPVVGAKNEWLALTKLKSLNVCVPEIIGYGVRGLDPAKRKSFVLMEEVTPTISLEELCASWKDTPPAFKFKQKLIEQVATIARILHTNGINHRDFYICHFLLDTIDKTKLYLIDLHRAQIRTKTPKRWIIKDMAGLYFSSKDIGLTKRDIYRFMQVYSQKSLRDIFSQSNPFWQDIQATGEQLYRDHHS